MAQIFKAKIMNEIKNNITGLILCVAIFAAAYLTTNLISTILSGNQNSPIPTVIFAVLIGILTKNILKPHARFEPGISFAQKNILRLGIIFLGITTCGAVLRQLFSNQRFSSSGVFCLHLFIFL